MIYTILISIVFIAEIIITATILQNLIKFDKFIIDLNHTVTVAKPEIKDICTLSEKISEQCVILSNDFVERAKKESEDIFLKYLSKILLGLLILNLNFKFIKNLRKSKLAKTLVKGFSLLENMI